MSLRSFLVPLPMCLLTVPPSFAEAPDAESRSWCGARPDGIVLSQARHEAAVRRLEHQRRSDRLSRQSAPVVYRDGQIAVIEDDGSLVTPPRPFELRSGLQFLRRARGLSVSRSLLPGTPAVGERLELADDDSRLVAFPTDFSFPFGDQVYRSVYVNSNGNLTFGQADPSSSADAGLLLDGPPRIAPLWTDLDPSSTVAEDDEGVYVRFLPNRLRVSWLDVPEAGTGPRVTVQVTLFANGRITFAYVGGASELENRFLVGVSPYSNGQIYLADFEAELPDAGDSTPPRRAAIVQEFSRFAVQDDVAIARTFFRHYRDVYDHLVVFLDFDADLGTTFAFGEPIQNAIQGIGYPIFDWTALVGSQGRLEHYVQMGTLSRYPASPDEVFLNRTHSTLAVLAHEVGHRWLTNVYFRAADGQTSDDLLDPARFHWSFHHHTGGSFLYGNDIVDNGDGSFSTTDRATTRYSELDQYLMGLIPVRQVPDFFHVANPSGFRPSTLPAGGARYFGDRADVAIEDVIAVEGPRQPASSDAPKSFRMAFIVVGLEGRPVSRESIDKVDRIRRRWKGYFRDATDSHGRVKTGLFPK